MRTPQMQNPIILKSGRKVVDDGRCRSLLQRYDHPRLRSFSVPGALYFIGTECRCTPAQLGAPDRAQRYERLRSYGSARNAAGKRYNAPLRGLSAPGWCCQPQQPCIECKCTDAGCPGCDTHQRMCAPCPPRPRRNLSIRKNVVNSRNVHILPIDTRCNTVI